MRCRRFTLPVPVTLIAQLAVASFAGGGVLPVSPGAADRIDEVTSACPTFSWSAAEGATGYELAVLDATDPENPILVLSREIAGAALSWTPARASCLAPGHDYAWVVRAARGGAEGGEWSAPLLFRVPGVPSQEELEVALRVLQRWRAGQVTGPAAGAAADSPPVRAPATARDRTAALVGAAAPLATGVAAIHGEILDVTGSAFGLLGISHSPQGAGVVARNQSSGADLILDGEAQGQADTRLTESGLDRPSGSPVTFNFQNSGAGGMTLQVEGVGVSTVGHHHLGETWSGNYGLSVQLPPAAIDLVALRGTSDRSPYGTGIQGDSSDPTGTGVLGWAVATSGSTKGVHGLAQSPAGVGGFFQNTGGGVGLEVSGNGTGRNGAALRVTGWDPLGGIAAYLNVTSPVATVHAANAGTGEVLYLQNGGSDDNGTGGNDFIRAVNQPENDSQFRVLTSGEVRSDVGYFTPAGDFAEMLPAAPGLAPGEVLAIGDSGALVRSTEAFATNVAGVYSTAPGFVGGRPVEGELAGQVPLAVVGIVPVKVSAENGSIAPGDLLVAAGTPGHAMRGGPAVPIGTVLGKALEPHASGRGMIRMLLVLQ